MVVNKFRYLYSLLLTIKTNIMKKINYLFFAVMIGLFALFFNSCKKEKTETNMIVKNWNLESKTAVGVSIITDCELNSKWNFKADGTYAIYDSCDNTETGSWTLDEDGKTLTLDNNTAYKVLENSLTKLVIEMQLGDTGLVKWSFN